MGEKKEHENAVFFRCAYLLPRMPAPGGGGGGFFFLLGVPLVLLCTGEVCTGDAGVESTAGSVSSATSERVGCCAWAAPEVDLPCSLGCTHALDPVRLLTRYWWPEGARCNEY